MTIATRKAAFQGQGQEVNQETEEEQLKK